MFSAQEVEKHNNRQSCWVIIEDEVYDVTDFIDEHPGGPGIILRYAGKVGLWNCDIILVDFTDGRRMRRKNTILYILQALSRKS